MKNFSHLSLVKKPSLDDSSRGASFELVALNELGTQEQRRVEKAILQVSPNAAIIGVQVTARSWDLRPVIVAQKESAPTVVRFLGPEVTLSPALSHRVEAVLRQIATSTELHAYCELLEWGLFEGQLWYRRPVVERTLAEKLLQRPYEDLSLALDLAKQIITAIEVLDRAGLVHGHITPENIAIRDDGTVSLLDVGISSAVAQACSQLGLESFPQGLDPAGFAPEFLSSDKPAITLDLYGLGMTLKEVFRPFYSRKQQGNERGNGLRAILDAVLALTDNNQVRRPTLGQLRTLLWGRDPVARQGGTTAPVRASSVKIKRPSQNLKPGEVQQFLEQMSVTSPMLPPPVASPTQKVIPPQVTPSQNAATKVAQTQIAPAKFAPAPSAPAQLPHPILPSTPTTDFSGVPAGSTVRELMRAHSAPLPNPFEENAFEALRAPLVEPLAVPPPAFPLGFPGAAEPVAKPLEQAVAAPIVSGERFTISKHTGNLIVWGGAFVGVLLAVYFFLLQESTPTYTREALDAAWASRRPSMMGSVAEAALAGDAYAEMLIVASVMQDGENAVPGVDSALLRTAFNERWESELKSGDRRTAMALALSGLLRAKTPKDLPSLKELHPGVILAITASAGRAVAGILNGVPVEVLGNLPPPIGPAFIELARSQQKLTCGNKVTQALARLATRDLDDAEELVEFLGEHTIARLRALAILFSQDAQSARKILDILLNHPNIEVQHEIVGWAKTSDLLSWQEINSSDQLLILAGIPSAEPVRVENIGKMFAHPEPAMRAFAIKRAVEEIKFSHPAAYLALKMLSDDPKLLDPKQTVQLANFLESPAKANPQEVRTWLASNPSKDLVLNVVMALGPEQATTPFDFELSRYLQQSGWKPSPEELKKLIRHPEKLTRFFAYKTLFESPDTDGALRLLKEAVKYESAEEFQQQLKFMISSLEQLKAK